MPNVRQRAAELDRLEQDLNTLRIDFERFFNGDLEIPPEQFRESIRGQIASLAQANKTAVDSFRLSALEARFHSWSELFNRRLRNRELRHGATRHPIRTSTPDPTLGIELGDRIDAARVAPLYRRLYQDEPRVTMDIDAFASYLARQQQVIRERTGCNRVSFRIVEENGKKKLKAKPVREVTSA
jgi:hypothetical protein